jgi:hypothetical protein
MATETRKVESKDVSGIILTTTTQQAFEEITPSEDVRAYQLEHVDGVYTLTEERISGSGTVHSVEGTTTQEPLETHPRFDSIPQAIKEKWTRWKKNAQDTYLKNWVPETEQNSKFQELYSFYTYDVTSYLVPRVVVRMTELEEGPPQLANVGKIDSPGITVGGAPNFILTGAHGQEEGAHWRNTYEWLGSGPGGWDAKIYGPQN